MYLTQINMIHGLTKAEYFQLRELCFFSNCLYNFALYNVRQKFFADKNYLRFEANYHECKDNDNYKLLQSNMAQQTLRVVDFAFKSFFATVGKVKGARPPHYRKKGGLFTLIITGNSISIQNGFLTVPQSLTYSKILNSHRIRIKVPERLKDKKIKEVRIIPLYKGRAFKVAYCYEVETENLTTRYIINFCTANRIGTVICGYNTDFKRGMNLGKKNNQQFTQIPFGALRRQLKTLCERYGMNYIEQEESYTSKASFLDLDELPIYDVEKPYTGTFSGKRIRRGLYRSKSGRLINADVNGAANILRKSKQRLDFERLCKGFLGNPMRIRIA